MKQTIRYQCENCGVFFSGLSNPQDTGDGPNCDKCWEAAN
jgi:hypothetical protein